jgi:acetyltransferase-like isoleucine patch superfamily enzyme
MKRLLLKILGGSMFRSDFFMGLYRRLVRGDGHAWAAYLKKKAVFFHMGDDCYISTSANITDPAYLRLGNNVRLSDCTILGHDGSVNMLNKALGTNLDSVGPVTIKDNVFIGHGAIVCPGVTIGPNAIVGAGSVVVRNVKEGEVVLGSPAKVVNRIEMSVDMLKVKNQAWPWHSLIEERANEFDPNLEPTLVRLRQEHFFPSQFQGL